MTAPSLREQTKALPDTADERIVCLVHAMLEADAEEDVWDAVPDNVQAELEESIAQAHRGEVFMHVGAKACHPQ